MMSGQPSFLVCRASRRLFSAKNSVDLLAGLRRRLQGRGRRQAVACQGRSRGRRRFSPASKRVCTCQLTLPCPYYSFTSTHLSTLNGEFLNDSDILTILRQEILDNINKNTRQTGKGKIEDVAAERTKTRKILRTKCLPLRKTAGSALYICKILCYYVGTN